MQEDLPSAPFVMRNKFFSVFVIILSGCTDPTGIHNSGKESTQITGKSESLRNSPLSDSIQVVAKENGNTGSMDSIVVPTNQIVPETRASVVPSSNKLSSLQKNTITKSHSHKGLGSIPGSSDLTGIAQVLATSVPLPSILPTDGISNTQNTEILEMEIQVPDESATVPAALASSNPDVPPSAQTLIDGIASDFVSEISDPENQKEPYGRLWRSAQKNSDDKFRKLFGQDAFLAYSIQAALEAKAASEKN